MNNTIKIRLYQEGKKWIADPYEYPGTPPIGRAHDKNTAIGHLINMLSHENYEWHEKCGFPKIEIVEDV